MASEAEFLQWARSVEKQSYYAILGVPNDASPAAIGDAFHSFALRCHPDRFVDDGPQVSSLAAEVFKRGAEAYGILTKPQLRARYDRDLVRGILRLDLSRHTPKPPPPAVRTLEMIARTVDAKKFATKADRLLSVGKLDEARVQLVNAIQRDSNNAELEERLSLLYEALALEPL